MGSNVSKAQPRSAHIPELLWMWPNTFVDDTITYLNVNELSKPDLWGHGLSSLSADLKKKNRMDTMLSLFLSVLARLI